MVLDTCSVIWLACDKEHISQDVLLQIEKSETVIINTLCFWEIGVKVKKKKLSLPFSLSKLIQLYADNSSVRFEAPDENLVITALGLKWEHKDPVDRFVVATAKKYDDTIVTADTVIKSFYRKTKI